MVNIIHIRNLEVPLIVIVVLVISSFFPLIHILVLTLNGAIIYPLYSFADSDKIASNYIFVANTLMSLLGLIFFHRSVKIPWVVFAAIFTVLFLLPLMVLIFGFIDTDMYFLQNLVAGLAVGLILLVVALLKRTPTKYSAEKEEV